MKLIPTLALVVVTSLPLNSNAEDWYRWRGPDADGISKEKEWSARWPAEGPKRLWKTKVGTGFSSVSVSKGRVYTMGNAADMDGVFCFDADTGKEVWKYSYRAKLDPKYYEGGPGSTPTVAGDHVFTFSKQGLVHCLEATSGLVVWSNNLMEGLKLEMPMWGFSGSILVEGDLCILNAGSMGTALDRKTGAVVWSSGADVSGYATPVPFDSDGERAVALFIKDQVVALRVRNGKELWRYPWKTEYDVNAADPIIDGRKVFVSSGYNRGGALIDFGGDAPKFVWENKDMRNHFNPSLLIGGFLYGFDGDSVKPDVMLKCVELKSGETKWTEKTGFGGLAAADGKLIVLTAKGELIVANATPDGFKPISRAQVLGGKCWTTPVLSNGKIYCRNAAGDLVCVDVHGE